MGTFEIVAFKVILGSFSALPEFSKNTNSKTLHLQTAVEIYRTRAELSSQSS